MYFSLRLSVLYVPGNNQVPGKDRQLENDSYLQKFAIYLTWEEQFLRL